MWLYSLVISSILEIIYMHSYTVYMCMHAACPKIAI